MSAYLQLFEDIAPTLPGSQRPLLRLARQAALARFSADGFPSPREEEWKYTNVSPIEKRLYKPVPTIAAASGDDTDLELPERYRLAGTWRLVLVNGHYSALLSDLEGLPDGLKIDSVAHLLQTDPERVEALLNRNLDRDAHGFIGYNGAFFADGVVVEVAADCTVELPLQVVHIATHGDAALVTRSLFRLGAGSGLEVIECFLGPGDHGYLTAAVSEASVGDGARLDYCRLQQESAKAYHFNGLYVRQGEASRFHHRNIDFGGLLARGEIHTELGAAAECSLTGLFLGRGRQHVDNHTLIQHRAAHGISSETYRGVLADRARGVFQGRIVVHPKAQKTQADMNNRNLLLSEDAEVDSKPQLEILADDVKCSHGVSVGQLDEESVFYLQSRGVDAESARNMLTFAFANEMIERIERSELRSLVQGQLLTLFPQTGIRSDWL